MKKHNKSLTEISFDEIVLMFLSYLSDRGRSPNTVSTYQKGLEIFANFFNGEITALTTPDVVAFKKYLSDKGASLSTINLRVATIRRFVNYLRTKQDLKFSKDLEFDKERIQDDLLDYVLRPPDIERLLRATNKKHDFRASAIITTLAYTGVRVHELLKIPLTAARQKSLKVRGKGGKERTVFVASVVRKSWKKYIEYRLDTDPELFTGRSGVLSRSRVHQILKYYAGQARIKKSKVHAHAFRHFCGKHLHDIEGYSISQCMTILGHSDPKTFLRYTKPTREEIEKKIQGSFKKPSKYKRKAKKRR